jgi:hypothetical protein
VHALRAELGIANAEVARLRHQLDVSQTSQQQERELTGHEILRLQQELSEAAASGSGGAAGGDAADEVTSRMGLANRVGSSSTSSWHSVHDNPAFEQAQQQQQSPSELQALLTADGEECDECEGEEGQEYGNQELVMQAGADVAAGDGGQLSRYEAKLQDQADTISSLQRQLKQQEQLLVALQKRERRVRAVPMCLDSSGLACIWVGGWVGGWVGAMAGIWDHVCATLLARQCDFASKAPSLDCFRCTNRHSCRPLMLSDAALLGGG